MVFTLISLSILNIIGSGMLLRRRDHRIVVNLDNIIIFAFIFIFSFLLPFDYFYACTHNATGRYLIVLSDFQENEFLVYYILEYLFLFVLVNFFRKIYREHGENCCMTRNCSLPCYFIFTVYMLMIIGIISDFLYLKAYGGYFNYLKYAGLIRSGVFVVDNPYSFLIAFRGFVVLSSILFLVLVDKRNVFHKIFFLFSILYSLFILYSNKGRLSLILYVLVFPIYFIFKRKQWQTLNISTIIWSVVGLLVFLGFIQLCGQLLDRSTSANIFETIASESAFPFVNFKLLINNDIEYRFFSDIISYPIFILPSSIWSKIYPTVASDILTIYLNGSKKGSGGVFGEAPADILSLSYMQLNVLGVIVVAALSAIVIALVFKQLKKIKNDNLRIILKIYLIMYLVLQSIFYGDSYNIVQRMFPLFSFLLLYVFNRFIYCSLHRRKSVQFTKKGSYGFRDS